MVIGGRSPQGGWDVHDGPPPVGVWTLETGRTREGRDGVAKKGTEKWEIPYPTSETFLEIETLMCWSFRKYGNGRSQKPRHQICGVFYRLCSNGTIEIYYVFHFNVLLLEFIYLLIQYDGDSQS